MRETWTNYLLTCLIYLISVTQAVKFPRQNGITVSGDGFSVGEFTSAQCNFIKLKQEDIHKVEWSISYDRVTTNVFTSYFENANKDTVQSAYFTVDEGSSGEKVVRLRINDDREDEISLCCKVNSVKDSGYGRIQPLAREKCSTIPVKSERLPVADVDMTVNKDLLRVGEQVSFSCEVDQIRDEDLYLAILINSNQVETKKVFSYDRQLKSSFTVTEDVFYQGQGEKFFLECLLKKGDYEVDRHSLTIKRDRSSQVIPSHLNQLPEDPVRARKGRFYTDPKFHDDHGNVPCHSYIILEEGSSQGALIKGDVPINIQGSILAQRTYDSRYETAQDVITVLNVLGYNGYRVVGMGNNMLNRITWTLERPYFEFHPNAYKP